MLILRGRREKITCNNPAPYSPITPVFLFPILPDRTSALLALSDSETGPPSPFPEPSVPGKLIQSTNNRGKLIVRAGKGDKDRVTVLPRVLMPELKEHIDRLSGLFAEDRAQGLAGVWLPEVPAFRKRCRFEERWIIGGAISIHARRDPRIHPGLA